jgi:hypothetical protein
MTIQIILLRALKLESLAMIESAEFNQETATTSAIVSFLIRISLQRNAKIQVEKYSMALYILY